MKPVIRYQSQLLFRKSYKPNRVIRIRPAKLNFVFRPVRFGLKPQLQTYECETHCAHIVEQLFRVAGELVYVCLKYPNGVSEVRYRQLLQSKPSAAQWGWQALRRNPRVYVRGRIRHPDHATITLPDWHRVVLNTETETDTMRNVAFID